MSEVRFVEHDGDWYIARYDGPLMGNDIPPLDIPTERTKNIKQGTHWEILGTPMNNGNTMPEWFATEQAARDYYARHFSQ
jgi:hypothetical protein